MDLYGVIIDDLDVFHVLEIHAVTALGLGIHDAVKTVLYVARREPPVTLVPLDVIPEIKRVSESIS